MRGLICRLAALGYLIVGLSLASRGDKIGDPSSAPPQVKAASDKIGEPTPPAPEPSAGRSEEPDAVGQGQTPALPSGPETPPLPQSVPIATPTLAELSAVQAELKALRRQLDEIRLKRSAADVVKAAQSPTIPGCTCGPGCMASGVCLTTCQGVCANRRSGKPSSDGLPPVYTQADRNGKVWSSPDAAWLTKWCASQPPTRFYPGYVRSAPVYYQQPASGCANGNCRR